MKFTQVICFCVLFYFFIVLVFFNQRLLTLPNSKFCFKYIGNLGSAKCFFRVFLIYVLHFYLRLVTFYVFGLKIKLWNKALSSCSYFFQRKSSIFCITSKEYLIFKGLCLSANDVSFVLFLLQRNIAYDNHSSAVY